MFMPHGMCFAWRPGVLVLHVLSDALIAVAYFSIPLLLVFLVRRRPDIPFLPVFWMFAAFIVSCGVTHIMSIVVIWHPMYWLEGGVKAATAAFSIATAIALVPLMPQALNLRTPRELERVNEKLELAVSDTQQLLRRYEREHYIATTLQAASLGELPETIGDLRISAIYQPAVGDLEIGGDWYDIFALPDGRVIVSIGDVAGKGLTASIIMAKMRQAIRVAAQVQVTPAAILDAADRSLRLEYPDRFVTAFVGIIDDTERVLAYANAGHPAPLMREPSGAIVELAVGGLPLGLRERAEGMHNETIALETGALLVLFTDGLTESTHDYAEGDRRVHESLLRDGVALARDPARALRDAVLFDGASDDVAILTIGIGAAGGPATRATFSSDDRIAAQRARDAIDSVLAERGANDIERFMFTTIYAELLGNVVRYAPGTIDVRLDWTADRPVLHVLDRGPGFQFVPQLPLDMLAESGRGLFIVHQMAPDFTIIRRPYGGSHARAVIPFAKAEGPALRRTT